MNCVSLYTGCGGLDLGFHQAGFKTIWANEISEDAMESYRQEMMRQHSFNVQTVCGDISQIDLPPRHCADIVIGGPPCQGFSVAGKMDPNDPRSRHVWEFFRVVQHLAPKAFVMENVKALAANQRWAGVRQALQAHAERLGYKTRILTLNAADYGVPQQRERMFLIGTTEAIVPRPQVPATRKTVREAFSLLPRYGTPGNNSLCRAIITPAKSPVLRKSPFAGMLFNGQGRPIDLEMPAPTLPASMGGNRTPIIDQYCLENFEEPWIVGYHKTLTETGEIASTIPNRLRRLTVEEAALLQDFPIGMQFVGSQCSKYKQIGNAVPPGLAYVVAMAVKSVLEGTAQNVEWNNNQAYMVAEDAHEYGHAK